MAQHKNPDGTLRVTGDRKVRVTIDMTLPGDGTGTLDIFNAAEALTFYAKNKAWKSWLYKIEVDEIG